MKLTTAAEDAIRTLAKQQALTPTNVIAAAADPASPLHAYFEWNDREASRQFRLTQARELIASVKVEVTIHHIQTRAPVYVHDVRSSDQGYVPLASVSGKERGRKTAVWEVKSALAAAERALAVMHAVGLKVNDGMTDVVKMLRVQLDELQL